MSDVAVVAQSVSSFRGTGANAYLYAATSGQELELQDKFETIPPGGNRVVATIELRGPAAGFPIGALALLDQIEAGTLRAIHLEAGTLHLDVAFPGGPTVPPSATDASVRAIRGLLVPLSRTQPLLVERTQLGSTVLYRLTDDSWSRLYSRLAPAHRPTWSVHADTKDAFEQDYGPFEQTLLLGSVDGLDEDCLMALGGYRVLDAGHVVYCWAWSPE